MDENSILTSQITENGNISITTLPNKQQHYIHQATAKNTRKAYQSAIKQYETYGGLLPATEQQIADYLTKRAAELNPRTLSLHLTALSHWHRYQELTDPTQSPRIRKLMSGIYRQHGQPKRQARALRPEQIKKMIEYCGSQSTLKSLRDSSLIQIAYFGAFRRSELIAITIEDLDFTDDGLIITIPKSKTDQFGEGKIKAIPYGNDIICPITALKHWLKAANIESGKVFRRLNRWDQLQPEPLASDSISIIVKALAKACNFDNIDQLSSHSLRRGFATSAANIGAEFDSIKRQGGWKSDQTVRSYIEQGQLFDNNAADQLIQTAFRIIDN